MGTKNKNRIEPFQRSWDWYDKIWKTVGKCVFCDLGKKYIIYEKNGIVLTANKFPYTNAHLLIVPRRHIEYMKELTNEEWSALRGVMYVAKKVLRKVYNKKNLWFIYREGAMGQAQKTVGHLHIQVVPYTDGLITINYNNITVHPSEVGTKLRKEQTWMDEKYTKYIQKYGKYTAVERRVVVNVIITNKKGQVLLVKKKATLQKGWQTPSGSVEGDETLEETLKREMKEETNLDVSKIKFLGMQEKKQDVLFEEGFVKKWNLIFMHYSAVAMSGRIKAGDDVKEVRWFSKRELRRRQLSEITERLLKQQKWLS